MRAILCGAMLALATTAAGAENGVLWYKQGASNVELERAKAACQSSQLEAAIAPVLAWFPIFELCMRANGWMEVQKPRSTAPAKYPWTTG
jgi:hypothetical protein